VVVARGDALVPIRAPMARSVLAALLHNHMPRRDEQYLTDRSR
jgi:hypothetical protein